MQDKDKEKLLKALETADKSQALKIKIMLMSADGKGQSEVARELQCSPLTVRHWAMMAKCGQIDSWKFSVVGRPPKLKKQELNYLRSLQATNPKEYGCERWSGEVLSQKLREKFGVEITARSINRALKEFA